MTKTMRFGAGLFAVALVAAVIGSTASAADAHGRRHRHHQPRSYVALGDSLTFGYSDLVADPWVPENFVGYPEIIGQRKNLAVTNLACPGQTATALVSRDAFDMGCFEFRDEAASEGIRILKADYAGTQLEAALDAVRSGRPPSLVSIQGGGNDWFACGPGNEDPNPDVKACMNARMPLVADSLRTVVNELRDAGYRGRTVLVGYHLVEGFEGQLRRLNRTIERAARNTNAGYGNAARPFRHYALQHGGDFCGSGLLVAFPDGSCDPLHPSLTGQQLVADAVMAAAGSDHRDCRRNRHHG